MAGKLTVRGYLPTKRYLFQDIFDMTTHNKLEPSLAKQAYIAIVDRLWPKYSILEERRTALVPDTEEYEAKLSMIYSRTVRLFKKTTRRYIRRMSSVDLSHLYRSCVLAKAEDKVIKENRLAHARAYENQPHLKFYDEWEP